MKKLSLKNLNLGASDLLQKNQLKTVFGGSGGYGNGDGSLCICAISGGQPMFHQFSSASLCSGFCSTKCPAGYSYGCA